LEDRYLLSAAAANVIASPIVSTTSQGSTSQTASSYTDFNLSTFASEDELRQYLIDQAVAQYRYQFGTHFVPIRFYPLEPGYFLEANAGLKFTDPVGQIKVATAASDSTSFSGTNNQVAGVDEADLVKTDGQYIYVFSGNLLSIIKAWPAQGLAIASQETIEGNPVGLYLDDGRLTVISTVYENTNARYAVKITVLDVSDPTSPQITQQTYLDGSYLSSRAIGDRIYVVVSNWFNLPQPEYHSDGDRYTYETEDAYRARLAALPLSSFLPHFYTPGDTPQDPLKDAGLLTDPLKTFKPFTTGYNQLISLVVLDDSATHSGGLDSVSVISPYSSIVYATPENLYLVAQRWNYPNPNDSLILKFHLGGDDVALTAAGAVPGSVSNSYFLSENNGYLRVVTYHWDLSGQASSLYVLAQQDGELEIVGSLQNLEPGESLYAAQFMGEDCFLITARRVDPLVTIDLSDPTNPRLMSELTIPGFLEYLQAIDSTHILGIGQQFHDLQISLFDISDLSHPVLMDQYVIGNYGDYIWSLANTDPHAFGYYPEYQTLAIPVSGYLSQTYGQISDFVVLGVDPTPDSTLMGPSVPLHLVGEIDQDGYLQRTLRIGGYLYSISNTSVQVQAIDNPQTEISEVYIQDVILHQAGTSVQANPGREFTGPVATFDVKDPSQVWTSINWGDGQYSNGTVVANADGSFSVVGTHTYFAEGNYSITVSISNSWSSEQVESTARVQAALDQKPVTESATGTAFAIFRGATLSGPGVHFTTDNPKGIEAIIDWGDGYSYGYPRPYVVGGGVASLTYGRGVDVFPVYQIIPGDPIIQPDGQGGYTILQDHTYYSPGTYTITVTIYNDDGIPTIVHSTVQVNWLPSDQNICGVPISSPVTPPPAPSPSPPTQPPPPPVPASPSPAANIVSPTQLLSATPSALPIGPTQSQQAISTQDGGGRAGILATVKPLPAVGVEFDPVGFGTISTGTDLSQQLEPFTEPLNEFDLSAQNLEQTTVTSRWSSSDEEIVARVLNLWEMTDFSVVHFNQVLPVNDVASISEDYGSMKATYASPSSLVPLAPASQGQVSIESVDTPSLFQPWRRLILLMASAPFALGMANARTRKIRGTKNDER
jgi:uncharacterized secreted protein with C-terminal beta-propeller domain